MTPLQVMLGTLLFGFVIFAFALVVSRFVRKPDNTQNHKI
jgi:hypothetical protein